MSSRSRVGLYFRAEDIRQEHLNSAPDRRVCEWKGGEAEYFDLVVMDRVNRAAAWRYPQLGENARALVGRMAFWKDVAVAWDGPGPALIPPVLEARMPNVAKALGATDVLWRPSLPGLMEDRLMAGSSGYLIPSLRVLVDVLATPPEDERVARMAEARTRGEVVNVWNRAHPDARYGFIAVWDSATPDPTVVGQLRAGAVLLDLT
ncbi:DUF427 domain-containing protein [Sphingomonas sp. PAMC 26605]|uniref:DUF427 domain-containing protein n=1 Tax=Sphingomonas sp. PAMC 26605 TaxID=1112214 RepID=UPI00026CD814|nr:DUF427 domain-containing protein [Sphingomonas sp. PAMC 26605]